MRREMEAIEMAFRRKTVVTTTLLRSIEKYARELRERDGDYVY